MATPIVIIKVVGAIFWAAGKLSGGEFSGPLFIRLKAVEQGRLGTRWRLEIGPRLPGGRKSRLPGAGRRGPI
ncbi:MAG: hypothetical protein GW948_02590 [Rhodobacterales bacterium]|nr:hypothetical protein [Rhodobacterales bacterium]